MNLSPDLSDAIERLYQAFANYPLPKYTDPCLHCHTLEDEAKLHSRPLRLLEAEDLRDFASDSMSVWGDVPELKHFLPRILEFLATTDVPTYVFVEPEILLSKLRYARWLDWPEDEQTSVKHFLNTLWITVLHSPPLEDTIDDLETWICSIAQCEEDLMPYLRIWAGDGSRAALIALSSFLITSSVTLRNGRAGRDAFWDGRDAQYEQLQDWVKTPAVREKLERAHAQTDDIELCNELAAAIGSLL